MFLSPDLLALRLRRDFPSSRGPFCAADSTPVAQLCVSSVTNSGIPAPLIPRVPAFDPDCCRRPEPWVQSARSPGWAGAGVLQIRTVGYPPGDHRTPVSRWKTPPDHGRFHWPHRTSRQRCRSRVSIRIMARPASRNRHSERASFEVDSGSAPRIVAPSPIPSIGPNPVKSIRTGWSGGNRRWTAIHRSATLPLVNS